MDPEDAPVVIWLQGGPGGSSLFGLLEIHGPFQSVFDGSGGVKAEVNPYPWTKEANVIYIDNPVGAGFSYSNKLPSTEEEVENNLYEFLQQWFKLFPKYQVITTHLHTPLLPPGTFACPNDSLPLFHLPTLLPPNSFAPDTFASRNFC